MTVTDDQVAALRAQLRGDRSEHERLFSMLSKSDADAYPALIAAAFIVAAERRFQSDSTAADVIQFVADVRGQTPSAAEGIDPKIGERLVLSVVADEDIDDIDGDTAILTELFLLAGMVASEGLQVAELDRLLEEAREVADEWASSTS